MTAVREHNKCHDSEFAQRRVDCPYFCAASSACQYHGNICSVFERYLLKSGSAQDWLDYWQSSKVAKV